MGMQIEVLEQIKEEHEMASVPSQVEALVRRQRKNVARA